MISVSCYNVQDIKLIVMDIHVLNNNFCIKNFGIDTCEFKVGNNYSNIENLYSNFYIGMFVLFIIVLILFIF